MTEEHFAKAKVTNAPISTKHSVELSRYLRYKNTTFAKKFLENVIALKEPVPYKRFTRDLGHKKGMAAGRYPEKAAKVFLKLIKGVEANAQDKGLNTANLKIQTLVPNKASTPQTGGRHRHGTKRTHIEIAVKEGRIFKKVDEKKAVKKEVKSESKKAEAPVKEEPKVQEAETKEKVEAVETKPDTKEPETEKIEIKAEEVKEEAVEAKVEEVKEPETKEPAKEEVKEVEQ